MAKAKTDMIQQQRRSVATALYLCMEGRHTAERAARVNSSVFYRVSTPLDKIKKKKSLITGDFSLDRLSLISRHKSEICGFHGKSRADELPGKRDMRLVHVGPGYISPGKKNDRLR